MALEISPLSPDRSARPDWGGAVSMTHYVLPAIRLLAALSLSRTPGSLMEDLRELASQGASVELLVSTDRLLVQVLIGGRRNPLIAAARDAALALLGDQARSALSLAQAPDGAGLGAVLADGSDPSLAARAATVGAQVQESRARAAMAGEIAQHAPRESPGTPIGAPLLAGTGANEAGTNLAHAVDASGLFLEAHLAQWLRGERTLRQVREEARALPAGRAGDAGQATEQRSAMQLDALQQQAITLTGQAWAGQPLRIRIERDRERHREAANLGDPTGLFQATLSLHLPRLGKLDVHIRVVEHTVGVRMASERAADLAPRLAPLAAALAARGLTLAELCAVLPQPGAPGMTGQARTWEGRTGALALSDDGRGAGAGQTQAAGLVATEHDPTAETIITRGRELGIPVPESRELVAALLHFDLDQRIPPALYVAVAQVLGWVFQREHERPARVDN